MAGRRIAVTLTLEVQQYIDNAVKAATATQGAKDEMAGLDREVAQVERGMAELAVVAKVAGKEVGDLGDSSNKATRDLSTLDRQIESTRRRVERLGIEFAATGDRVAGKRFGDQQSLLGKLEALRTTLKDTENDGRPLSSVLGEIGVAATPAAGAATKAVSGGASASFGSPLWAVVGGAAAVLVAPLGAMIAGVVAGTIGSAGIAGGILAASHDPKVKAAEADFLASVEGTFFAAGSSFIDPLLAGLPKLSTAIAGLGLDKTFALVAPDLPIILNGITELVQNLMPGLNLALSRAGPFAAAAGKGLAYLGTSLSEFMDNVTASPGAVEGLTLAFELLGGTIKGLGGTLKFTADIFHLGVEEAAGFFTVLDGGLSNLGIHIPTLRTAAEGFQEMLGRTNDAVHPMFAFSSALDSVSHSAKLTDNDISALTKEMDDFNKVVSDLIDNTLGLDEANTAMQKGFKALEKSLQQNGSAFAGNSDAAIANQEALQAQIEKIDKVREAEIKAGVSAKQADDEYLAQVQFLLDLAKAAGISSDALDALAKKYVISIEIASNLPAIGAAISAQFQGALLNGGGLTGGGPALPGYQYTVGETQPETLTMFPGGGGYVTPSRQYNGAGMGGGGSTHVVDLRLNGRTLKQLLITDGTNRGVSTIDLAAAYP